jgi:predicted esterase
MLHINQSSVPHGDEPVVVTGNTIAPTKALLLLHGRGASAESIMHLTHELSLSDDCIVLAPQAAAHVWYPERFTVDTTLNQPHLDSALDRICTIVSFLETEYNIKPNQIVLAGFSQGACLAAEYLKQYPTTYKGAAIFSGGLIGNESESTTLGTGTLHGTPVYIGCDDKDFHIPKERVTTTAQILTTMGATVNLQLYKGLGHTIHTEGLSALQNFIDL